MTLGDLAGVLRSESVSLRRLLGVEDLILAVPFLIAASGLFFPITGAGCEGSIEAGLDSD